MSPSSRLVLILAGASAWLLALARPDFTTLFDPASELWNLPALADKWDTLAAESARWDERIAAWRRVCERRRAVLHGLASGRLDVHEAIERFDTLASLRKESGPARPTNASSASPALQLLNWIKEERKEPRREAEQIVLEQVEAELRCLTELGH